MRIRTGWLAWLLTAGAALTPAALRAQEVPPADPVWPLPLYSSHPERGGFYAAAEFLFFRQTNPLEDQLIAVRGFRDVDGQVQQAINTLTGVGIPVVPGAFFGSGRPALDVDQVTGPLTYTPGWGLTLGWRFDEGSWVEAVEFRWRHLTQARYSAGATIVPPDFRLGEGLEDSFLFSPVFNFPPEFAGPAEEVNVSRGIQAGAANVVVQQGPGTVTLTTIINGIPAQLTIPETTIVVAAAAGNAVSTPYALYGIWNGATNMTISFTQRYDDYELVGRVPIYQDEYCRCYGLVGPRVVSLWERFQWRTEALAQPVPTGAATASVGSIVGPQVTGSQQAAGGVLQTTISTTGFTINNITVSAPGAPQIVPSFASPEFVAVYSNVVSNRMYGPMIGWGTEYYLGHGFSAGLDVRASVLVNVVNERAKYERGDEFIQNKRSRREYTIAPELSGEAHLTWYPIEGVEMRVGYEVMTFFNTVASPRPVSFNYGSLDPPWEKGIIRVFDGFSAGIALIF